MSLDPVHPGKRFLEGALLLATSLFLISACSPSNTPAPKALTLSRLKHVAYVIAILEEESQTDLSEQLRDSTNIHEIVFSKLLELVVNEGTAIEQLCYDGYGRQFSIGIKSNLVARGASPALVSARSDIIVWSSGIDGQDDLGWGDDIVLSISDTPEN